MLEAVNQWIVLAILLILYISERNRSASVIRRLEVAHRILAWQLNNRRRDQVVAEQAIVQLQGENEWLAARLESQENAERALHQRVGRLYGYVSKTIVQLLKQKEVPQAKTPAKPPQESPPTQPPPNEVGFRERLIQQVVAKWGGMATELCLECDSSSEDVYCMDLYMQDQKKWDQALRGIVGEGFESVGRCPLLGGSDIKTHKLRLVVNLKRNRIRIVRAELWSTLGCMNHAEYLQGYPVDTLYKLFEPLLSKN